MFDNRYAIELYILQREEQEEEGPVVREGGAKALNELGLGQLGFLVINTVHNLCFESFVVNGRVGELDVLIRELEGELPSSPGGCAEPSEALGVSAVLDNETEDLHREIEQCCRHHC